MPASPYPSFSLALDHPDLIAGLVWASDVHVSSTAPDSPLASRIAAAVELRRAEAERESGEGGRGIREARRQAIRDLLRRGGYKPTGRGKPASEYLAGVAARGEFPAVTNVVDAINVVSLETGLPISLIDLGRAEGLARELEIANPRIPPDMAPAPALELRFGHPDERFVFNSVGQEIDVEGLLGVALAGGPMIANPVKDRMATKVQADSQHILAVVYASGPDLATGELEAVLADLAAMFVTEAGAARVETEIRS